jgi:hypothetical protein
MSFGNVNFNFENAGPSGFPNSFPNSFPSSYQFSSSTFDGSCSPGTKFTSFTGSDCGDPHLADSYTTQSGVTGSQKWDSMSGISDLLSGSQFGGFQYSTGVTTPSQNGVTLNDEFNAQFGNGSTIDMNTSGAPEININGTAQQMQVGQTYQIDGSTSATWDGSKLTISQSQGNSSLTTTVANDSGHLDINCSGQGDQLSGALTGNQAPANPVPFAPQHHHHHHHDGDGDGGSNPDPSQNSQWQSEISSLEALIANLESLMPQGESSADTSPQPLPQDTAVPT